MVYFTPCHLKLVPKIPPTTTPLPPPPKISLCSWVVYCLSCSKDILWPHKHLIAVLFFAGKPQSCNPGGVVEGGFSWEVKLQETLELLPAMTWFAELGREPQTKINK